MRFFMWSKTRGFAVLSVAIAVIVVVLVFNLLLTYGTTYASSPPPAPTGLTKISPDNNPLPAFKWNAVGDAVAYEVQVNSGSWMNIGNNLTYVQTAVLSRGSHTFSVRAVDGIGNVGPAASMIFQVSVVANLANTRIVFAAYRDGNAEIYMMNADGSGQSRLTDSPASDSGPFVSPDGSKIVFASTRDGNWEIYIMNVDGSAPTRLTSNSARDDGVVWSPDGSKIAFRSDRDGNMEIYVMNADGSAQTNLSNNPAFDSHPSWSPDGTKIVFLSERDGNREIYVMNADGSAQTRLTSNPAQDLMPAWSPDGSEIVFTSERDGNYEIYVMNADGSGQTRLTNHPSHDYDPEWSPDGSKIVFVAERDGNSEIYVMNSSGSFLLHLTNEPTDDQTPSWSPFLLVEVEIDIKVGSYPNSINLSSRGVVPVAVLTTPDFDASTIDSSTVRFADASPVRWTPEDVDGDLDLDMLFHFKTRDMNLTSSSTEATLTGDTWGGQSIRGIDQVKIVP